MVPSRLPPIKGGHSSFAPLFGITMPPSPEAPESLSARFQLADGPTLKAAIRCLLGGRGPATSGDVEAFLAHARATDLSLDNLWLIRGAGGRSGEVDAACLCVPSPGATGMIFAGPFDPAAEKAVVAVIDGACGEIDRSVVSLAQALVDPAHQVLGRALESARFTKLATLELMRRRIQPADHPPPPLPENLADHVEIVPWRRELDEDVISILDASYIDTLDCPGLRGIRKTSDILAGHHATGVFDGNLWTIIQIDGRPVGVVLLNPCPDQETVELVYVGLCPTARRRGLGRWMIEYAISKAATTSMTWLTLAVDEGNHPAMSVYNRSGFQTTSRRMAYIRVLESS